MTNWATKASIFGRKVPKEKFLLPDSADEWIWIYGLTAGEKDDYENTVMSFDRGEHQLRMKNARAVLLQMSLRNQHGNLLFAASDIGKISQIPACIADPILNIARRLSGMATGEIEELVKNSQTDLEPSSGGSGSGSPDISAVPSEK